MSRECHSKVPIHLRQFGDFVLNQISLKVSVSEVERTIQVLLTTAAVVKGRERAFWVHVKPATVSTKTDWPSPSRGDTPASSKVSRFLKRRYCVERRLHSELMWAKNHAKEVED